MSRGARPLQCDGEDDRSEAAGRSAGRVRPPPLERSIAPKLHRQRVVMAWSGGKDSAMALHALRQQPGCEIVALLTTITDAYDRISMHGVRRSLLDRQAAALGLPVEVIRLSVDAPNDEYEAKMRDVLRRYARRGVTGVAFGDIFLEDLRAYREARLAQVGMAGLFPLWRRDTADLVNEFLALGFRAIVTAVDSRALPQSFAGRSIDAAFLAALPAGVDPCGENGEFHSFVHAGPIFREPLEVRTGEVVKRDRFYFCDLLPAEVPTAS